MKLVLYVEELDALVLLHSQDIETDEDTELALLNAYLKSHLPSCASFDFILIGEL